MAVQIGLHVSKGTPSVHCADRAKKGVESLFEICYILRIRKATAHKVVSLPMDKWACLEPAKYKVGLYLCFSIQKKRQ